MSATVPVAFPYQSEFIPKGGRKSRTAYLRGDGYAALRKVERAALRPAFRLVFPRETEKKPLTLNILWFENTLWWPLPNWFFPGRSQTNKQFVAELARGRDIFGFNCSRKPTLPAVETKVVIRDNREHALALLQRKLSDNILLCGNFTYAAGGEPVYVQERTRGGNWITSIANISAERSAGPASGLRNPPGREFHSTKQALRQGAFQLADQRGLAEWASSRRSIPAKTMPVIEVLMPEAMRASADQVRLDELFRFAVDPRQKWFWWVQARVREELRDALNKMMSVAKRDPSAPATNTDRLDALLDFITSVENDDYNLAGWSRDFRHLRHHVKQLARSEILSGLWSESRHLAAVDEESLSLLT